MVALAMGAGATTDRMRSISVHTFTSAASARGIGFARAGGRERPGTQAVDRALWLLLHMAGETGAGLSLKDVSASAGLDPATTHRLLGSLKRFGLVEQNPQTRRYGLGLEFFALAAAASGRLQLAERIRPTLAALSRASGLRSVCFVRNGPDLVCVETHPGRSPSAFGARDRG
ncbi:MAG TPA: helix-turn-helix domain-containing protein, partial [Beijerinckiaceae bacterium]|nr:helix-turn-helix domain-containing protein [Beijerinckiaceae bacterium]